MLSLIGKEKYKNIKRRKYGAKEFSTRLRGTGCENSLCTTLTSVLCKKTLPSTGNRECIFMALSGVRIKAY